MFAGKTWAERSLLGQPLYDLTQEQRAVIGTTYNSLFLDLLKIFILILEIECDVGPGQVLMVTAFAGAGKTSSLIEYARRYA